MALDAPQQAVPETPEWWLARLALRLQDRRPDLDRLHEMFIGKHPLPPSADADDVDEFKRFATMARSNYLSLVVEAAVERMRVIGILAGPEDREGDKVSWALWQLANLDADQVLVHRTMLALRRAYVIVSPHPRKSGRVLITPEDPREVIVEGYPEDRREARAALKIRYDSVLGREVAWVYLPRGTFRFVGPKHEALSRNDIDAPWTADALGRWERIRDLPNVTQGEVPVVEFTNRPGLLGTAMSEFEDVIDIQNRINATLLHRLVAEKFAVIRQRAILNLEFDDEEVVDPETGEVTEQTVVPELPNDPRVAWLLQGEHLSLWESSQTSTADILTAIAADIRDLAAITRTPPHYLLNSIVNASGDALKSAETGLVSKVREHLAQASDSWERVMHLAHLVAGTDRAEADLEIRWADPESRSLAELADASVKYGTAGVPWRGRMELLGKSPQEIARWDADRVQDAMITAMAAPAPSAPATGSDPALAESDDEEAPSADGS